MTFAALAEVPLAVAGSGGFIDLSAELVIFLLLVGFVGGLVSGFIGSGGAFVLTPAMISLGVPGVVAVASNMCHKFPKALVGGFKRAKLGHVDVKLGLTIGVSAEAGVLVGAVIQERINHSFGEAGSNLYVSTAFVVVLGVVGTIVLRDALRGRALGENQLEEKPGRLAQRVRSIRIPGTMVYFKGLGGRVSLLFTIPLGFATGFLAGTIAVGGFVGVPGMIYLLGAPAFIASGTELVVAFVMGLGGTLKYGLSGFVDLRLAMIILAGSLFGIQLGALGTSYVKPYMIKLVMGMIMLMVLVSRLIAIPTYLSDLDLIAPISGTLKTVLETASLATMVAALAIGATIILRAIHRGRREDRETPAVLAPPREVLPDAPAMEVVPD